MFFSLSPLILRFNDRFEASPVDEYKIQDQDGNSISPPCAVVLQSDGSPKLSFPLTNDEQPSSSVNSAFILLPHGEQCEATTQNKKRCKNISRSGRNLCHFHR